MKRKNIELQLDKSTRQKLKKMAKDEHRNVRQQLEILIKDGVEHIEIDKIKAGFTTGEL